MIELSFRPLRYRNRWFAYLDLLGFTNLVQSKAIEDVLPIYAEALKRMRTACKAGKQEVGLISTWFSDTFIIYSRSDTLHDFVHLESAARIFFQMLLIKHIPVRGCISHGKLYSQAKKNVFVGPALIEAHTFGEALDWVGLCFAPSVEARLNTALPLSQRAFYRTVSDRAILRNAPAEALYAFAFNNGTINGRNPYRDALQVMRSTAPFAAVKKYDNSMAFLDRFA
jgi:hypothetical protein